MNKNKSKKTPICYNTDNKLNLLCKGEINPQCFAENDCYTCEFYNNIKGEKYEKR